MPNTAAEKREIRHLAAEPIPEMCSGCARVGRVICRTITEPGYFYEHYGECFAKVSRQQAKQIEDALRSYSPSSIRWLQRVRDLQAMGVLA